MTEFINRLVIRVRLIRWRLGARRCVCGEHVLAPRTTMELAGVKHRTDGPCFHCDTYGNPL
jgi:hypothetical protein